LRVRAFLVWMIRNT